MVQETTVEIPLSSNPEIFLITLAGVVYQCMVRWNKFARVWCLDVGTEEGVPVLHGIPIIPGVDLLAQHRHLGFGGALVVRLDRVEDDLPTLDNLGSESHLLFIYSE